MKSFIALYKANKGWGRVRFRRIYLPDGASIEEATETAEAAREMYEWLLEVVDLDEMDQVVCEGLINKAT